VLGNYQNLVICAIAASSLSVACAAALVRMLRLRAFNITANPIVPARPRTLTLRLLAVLLALCLGFAVYCDLTVIRLINSLE